MAAGRFTVYFGHDAFVVWLDRQIATKVGWQKRGTEIAREAGIHHSVLPRILRWGERPAPKTVAALAEYLDIPLLTFRQRAGLEPIIRDGEVLGEITAEEMQEILVMVNRAADSRKGTEPH